MNTAAIAEKTARGSCVPGWALCYYSGSQSLGKSGNNSVVECDLAKVEVAGSNPVSRSNLRSHPRPFGAAWRLEAHPNGAVAKW